MTNRAYVNTENVLLVYVYHIRGIYFEMVLEGGEKMAFMGGDNKKVNRRPLEKNQQKSFIIQRLLVKLCPIYFGQIKSITNTMTPLPQGNGNAKWNIHCILGPQLLRDGVWSVKKVASQFFHVHLNKKLSPNFHIPAQELYLYHESYLDIWL